jgi:hypothetical protein
MNKFIKDLFSYTFNIFFYSLFYFPQGGKEVLLPTWGKAGMEVIRINIFIIINRSY